MKRTLILSAALLAAALAAVGLPGAAVAAPPANDDFVNAVAIDPASLPFSDSLTIDDATFEGGEPSGCYVAGKSVWHSVTPTSNAVLRANIGSSSFFDRILYVYRQDGSGFGGLSTIGCASPYYNGQSTVTFNVEAGKTYFLQAGGFYPWTSGTLNLFVEEILPPPNDDFANAAPIGPLPFSDSVDATAASVEAAEPTPSCGYGQSQGTVWYSFTPSTSRSYSASSPWSGIYSQVSVWTGSGLGSPSEIGCRSFGQLLTFRGNAGTTYYVQVGGIFGARGPLNVSLDVAPNPIAGFGFYPGDP